METPAIILKLTKKNIPAETAEHNLDSVGLFTRSMNSTNTEGLSLSRGEQGAWSPGKFLNFELPKSPVFFPAHGTWTDGGLVKDFLPYLFALVGYLFLKFSQPLPSQKLNGWHLGSYFVVDLLVDAFGGKKRNNSKFWREQGKKDQPPGRPSITKMIFMLDWVG